MSKQISKMDTLRTTLDNLIDEVKKGHISPAKAAEMSNAAGKIINSIRAEVEYEHSRQKLNLAIDIPYFEKSREKIRPEHEFKD